MKVKIPGIGITADSGQPGRVYKRMILSEEGAINAVHEDVIGVTHRDEAEHTGLDTRWTLSKERRKCKGLVDVQRFCAMVVEGKNRHLQL